MIDSSKQTVQKGIAMNFNVSINYLQLNKSCTVAHIWWDINVIPPSTVSQELREIQLRQDREYVENELARQRALTSDEAQLQTPS